MSQKAKLKIYICVIIAILFFAMSVALIFFGIHPRTVMCENGEIKTYNSFNEATETLNLEQADNLVFRINIVGARHKSYTFSVAFAFGEKEYSFLYSQFAQMETEEALEYMLRLKSDFGGKCIVEDAELIEKLCKDQRFTETEKLLVYELFDCKN